MKNLITKGKITIFKTFIHLALITGIPKATVIKLEKIQKEFIWSGTSTPKIKLSTLCKIMKVDILSKITSLQCF